MSLGSIGSSALSPLYALRVRSLADDNSSGTASQPSAACEMCASPPAQLPAAQSPGGLTVQGSHLELQIRSRTQLSTASDGALSERTNTKLRFHYDLTTADGQHIELEVKAKVRQTSIQDAAGNSISKTQVKLQFSLLQEGVVEDLSPLQSDQVPSDTQSGVSDGLAAFLSSVGAALQNFVEGDNVTADDLLKKTVDTFNTLVDALTHLLFPAAENEAPPALPASGEPAVQIPAIAPPSLSDSQPTPAAPANEPSIPEVPSAASEQNAIANDPASSAAAIPVDPTPADEAGPAAQPAPVEGSVAPPTEPDAATSPAQLATQVLQTVRLRFVQSLTQIIRSLTPQESGTGSSLTFQRLDYHSSLSLKIHTASLLDVNA